VLVQRESDKWPSRISYFSSPPGMDLRPSGGVFFRHDRIYHPVFLFPFHAWWVPKNNFGALAHRPDEF